MRVVTAAGMLVVSLLVLQVLLDSLNIVVNLVQLLDNLLFEIDDMLAGLAVVTRTMGRSRAVVRGTRAVVGRTMA